MTDIAETLEVVGRDQWIAARKQFLMKEKDFIRARDALCQERRLLPWEVVKTDYVFEGPEGPETLSQLFAGRSQLIVYHFMFNPMDDMGCPHCSLWAGSFNDNVIHLNHRHASFGAISRAPYAAAQLWVR